VLDDTRLTKLGDLDVIGPGCDPDNLLGNIVTSHYVSFVNPVRLTPILTRVKTGIDAISSRLVASESNDREFSLDHAFVSAMYPACNRLTYLVGSRRP
jgi:hypothetical protein